ncbi:MAG: alpha-mannosidase [Fimbriimonadaceae bacterium]|nr:alpha-mannosidase [Fimbriimonadaceae bacterium]
MAGSSLHLICNAHLDPVWQWEWEEGAAEAIATFRCAADLCEEFDEFVFCHNEAILYEWVEEYEPALFARIQRLVAAGRWQILGGWFLQPDCNMPCGESFVRQALCGRRYFAAKFGVRPTTAVNFDPFGHTRGLVQILAKCGYDSYVFCRPSPGQCALPAERFRWVGYDGSTVLAQRCGSYNSPLGQARQKVEHHLAQPAAPAIDLVLWGVGNHGGGPSREDLQALRELIASRPEAAIRHSTLEQFWAAVRAGQPRLPRHEGDINPFAVGCYTSQVRLKQKHRLLENELYALEKMACAAWVQGRLEYPAAELAAAQHDLLTSQFHDILPGSSVQPVEETSLRLLDHGLEEVSRAKARAFFALAAGQPAANPGEIPILVYNPHPFVVRTTVECEFQLADQNWTETFTDVTVCQGRRRLPTQVEQELGNIPLDWRKRVAFQADLQPSQINRFDCRLQRLPQRPARQALPAGATHHEFANGDLAVRLNLATGLLDGLAVGGVEYLRGPAAQALVLADSEDSWGMRERRYDQVVGQFELLSPAVSARLAGVQAAALPAVRVVEDGPVRLVVEAALGYGRSALILRYLLPRRGTEVGLEARVQWAEQDRLLKLAFPLAGELARYCGQVAYGVGELPTNGDEAVAQRWVAAVAADGRAVTVINDGVYGSDCSAAGLRLTLLRSPAYTGHPIGERSIVPQDRFTARIDQGERLFRCWLNAGPAAQRLARIDREAAVRNETPVALSFHPSGAGEAPLPLVVLRDGVTQLSALKRSEDGQALIVRLFEPTGRARSTTLELPALGLTQPVRLGRFEVKTLRVDLATRSVVETNLLEEVAPSG